MLRLLEDFPERQVTSAVRDAVKQRLIGFVAVKHLLVRGGVIGCGAHLLRSAPAAERTL